MSKQFDLSVYLVTDRPLCRGRSLEEVVSQALAGGVSMVQLREKTAPTREIVELARALKKICAPQGVPLIINDRLDVALAAEADGAHVGQSDMHWRDARGLLGPEKILGLTIDTMQELRDAAGADVDYLGVGPIFPTKTKVDAAKDWGMEQFAAARGETTLPYVGIGSVNAGNAAEVIAAGADGVAVVSAICSADSPQEAAHKLAQAVQSAR